MLSEKDNADLCHIGPGTLMGDLMRLYWLPAMRSDELSAPDCPPLRVKLLGEELIAFSDSTGRVGLVQNACPHRGASLFFGRNEDGGLRCVYHGWKFDVTGACVEMPSEPAESNFKNKVLARAYPCTERGGLVWTYMGPRETPPPLPEIEANLLPPERTQVHSLLRSCNWMQALEGDLDTVHVAFLHSSQRLTREPGTFGYFTSKERAARFVTMDADYGVTYGAYRAAEDDSYYWRIANFLFPFWVQVPTGTLGIQKMARAWVPMDDYHTMDFIINDPSTAGVEPPPSSQTAARAAGAGTAVVNTRPDTLPNASDWFGRFRPNTSAANDYLIDRDDQRSRSFTSIPGIISQDQAVTESMGTIYSRNREHLGSTDAMVIRVRRRLLQAARSLRDECAVPYSVDHPYVYAIRSGGVVLPRTTDWWDGTKDLRRAFVSHPDLEALVMPAGNRYP
jgi:phenylpropionate dioxygenase-like ring-hydroxylating dioxygenase large terminal subunit